MSKLFSDLSGKIVEFDPDIKLKKYLWTEIYLNTFIAVYTHDLSDNFDIISIRDKEANRVAKNKAEQAMKDFDDYWLGENK